MQRQISKENIEKAKRCEALFIEWLNSGNLAFFRLDQEKKTMANTFRYTETEGKTVKRPDFFVKLGPLGMFAIDTKHRNYKSERFDINIARDYRPSMGFDLYFGICTWFAIRDLDEEEQDSNWYFTNCERISELSKLIKMKNDEASFYAVKKEDCIAINDVNDLGAMILQQVPFTEKALRKLSQALIGQNKKLI